MAADYSPTALHDQLCSPPYPMSERGGDILRHTAAILFAATAFAVPFGSMAPGLAPPAARRSSPGQPPGDIPDSQVFVSYSSPAGFSLNVPEGWARTERPDGANFADKYGSVDISLARAASAPTPDRCPRKRRRS